LGGIQSPDVLKILRKAIYPHASRLRIVPLQANKRFRPQKSTALTNKKTALSHLMRPRRKRRLHESPNIFAATASRPRNYAEEPHPRRLLEEDLGDITLSNSFPKSHWRKTLLPHLEAYRKSFAGCHRFQAKLAAI